MPRSLVTAPTDEPLTVAELKTHLRVDADDTSEDDDIFALITAARGHVESETDRALITQTWQITLDRFPRFRAPIELPLPPLQSVTFVKYLDPSGALITWPTSEYVVTKFAGPRSREGRLYPALEKDYPATACRPDAVTIELIAGYGLSPTVPEGLKAAMRMLVANWWENREATVSGTIIAPVPLGVDALLAPFRRLTNAVR